MGGSLNEGPFWDPFHKGAVVLQGRYCKELPDAFTEFQFARAGFCNEGSLQGSKGVLQVRVLQGLFTTVHQRFWVLWAEV